MKEEYILKEYTLEDAKKSLRDKKSIGMKRAWSVIKKVHFVLRNDFCYYCEFCGEARGDGDNFIGKKCKSFN